MGRIIRVKVNWTGFVGSPGYTNFHFEPTVEADPFTQVLVDAAVAKVQTWLTSNKTLLPASVQTGIDAVVPELDESTYDIQSFWTATPAAPAAGTSATGTFTGGAGYCISWGTSGVRNGRRVRGRTFVVPISTANFESDGSIAVGNLTSMRNAANALLGSSNGVRLVIHAKTPGALVPDGGAYFVESANVRDRPAFLTSRRG